MRPAGGDGGGRGISWLRPGSALIGAFAPSSRTFSLLFNSAGAVVRVADASVKSIWAAPRYCCSQFSRSMAPHDIFWY